MKPSKLSRRSSRAREEDWEEEDSGRRRSSRVTQNRQLDSHPYRRDQGQSGGSGKMSASPFRPGEEDASLVDFIKVSWDRSHHDRWGAAG